MSALAYVGAEANGVHVVDYIASRFASSRDVSPESVAVFARRYTLDTGHGCSVATFEHSCPEAGFPLERRRDGAGSRVYARWLGLPPDISFEHGRAFREAVERSVVPVSAETLRDVVVAIGRGVRRDLDRTGRELWFAWTRAAGMPDVEVNASTIRCTPPPGHVFDDRFLGTLLWHPLVFRGRCVRLVTPEAIVLRDVPYGSEISTARELHEHARVSLVRE